MHGATALSSVPIRRHVIRRAWRAAGEGIAVPFLRAKNLGRSLAGALLAATLVVAPLVTAGASATEPSPTAELIGTVGTMEDFTPEANSVEYWEALYADHKADCYKTSGNSSHGKLTNGGKTVTLYPYQESWPGDHWEVLVVKAGTTNNVIHHPVAGVAYASPLNNGGKQATVSHWIVCKGTTPPVEEPPTEQPPATVTSVESSSHDCRTAIVTITKITTTTPFVWLAGKWTPGTPSDVTTMSTRGMTVAEKLDCPLPETQIEYAAWVDGEWECGDTQVTQTREVTTTVHGYDAEANPTVTSSVAIETQQRQLTQDEIAECPLVPGDITSACVGDVPYLQYGVTLPEGLVIEDPTPVTITFVNPDGENYVIENMPLSSAVLWPGASASEPKMWPGWALEDEIYVPTDGNFAWTREGVTVRFDANPSYETTVTYPQASAICANPAPTAIGGVGPDPVPAPAPAVAAAPGALAATGTDVPMWAIGGAASALLAGIALVAFAVRRRATNAA
jgi:hypothetical protein